MEKRILRLFDIMKSKNLFWSYDKNISAADIGTDILVETVLKYGDVDDIQILFECCEYQRIFDVWVKRVVFDHRFDKLNFYLARVFFDVDIDTVRCERAGYERRVTLERLASSLNLAPTHQGVNETTNHRFRSIPCVVEVRRQAAGP